MSRFEFKSYFGAVISIVNSVQEPLCTTSCNMCRKTVAQLCFTYY